MRTSTYKQTETIDQENFFAKILETVGASDPWDIDEEIIRQERIAIMIYDGGESEDLLGPTPRNDEKEFCDGTRHNI